MFKILRHKNAYGWLKKNLENSLINQLTVTKSDKTYIRPIDLDYSIKGIGKRRGDRFDFYTEFEYFPFRFIEFATDEETELLTNYRKCGFNAEHAIMFTFNVCVMRAVKALYNDSLHYDKENDGSPREFAIKRSTEIMEWLNKQSWFDISGKSR